MSVRSRLQLIHSDDDMKLVVTIDTEEDNWLPYSRNGYTTTNALRLPRLQQLFSGFGIRPTYLVTYQMVTQPDSAAVLRDLHRSGGCEIGAHCHPWSQPPHDEQPVIENSMLCNLPAELQARKIEHLHQAIQDRLGVTPVSFRSGRWGYSPAVAATLAALGYTVDSSITARTDWSDCHGPDFSRVSSKPYRFDPTDIYRPKQDGCMLEVPGTVGYLQRQSTLCHSVYEGIRRTPLRHFRLIGLLERARLLNRVSLTPELSEPGEMAALLASLKQQGESLATLWFHSSTLIPGVAPRVLNERDVDVFLGKLGQFFEMTRTMGIDSITLAETPVQMTADMQS